MVIVPVVDVSRLSELALSVAYRIGGEVVPVTVSLEPQSTRQLCARWKKWDPRVELRVLPSPHRSLVAPIVGYVQTHLEAGRHVTVLLAEVENRKRRYQILHNQRGLVLAAALRSRTDAVVATESHQRGQVTSRVARGPANRRVPACGHRGGARLGRVRRAEAEG